MDANRRLELLEWVQTEYEGKEEFEAIGDAIAALKAEPVAWMVESHDPVFKDPMIEFIQEGETAVAVADMWGKATAKPLYTNPQPARQPKRLEWVQGWAQCAFGCYCIHDNRLGMFLPPHTHANFGEFDTEDEAKAAAQADFDKRAWECFDGR